MRQPADTPRSSRAAILALVFILACFWWTSFYGLNFGTHWDEPRAKFDAIHETLKTGLFIQGAGLEPNGGHYNYGGMNYLLTWAGFAPEVFKFLRTGPLTLDSFSNALSPIIYDMKPRLRVRAIYMILSSLSILWLFCLNRVLGRSAWESLLAAAILAGSWEVAYHSRWVAPDAVMMQFALLSFLCLAIGCSSQNLRWFYAAAFAAGLTAGTKYTGGMVLPFILAGAAAAVWWERHSLLRVVKLTAALTATSAIAFVITSPGAVLDPFHVLAQLREQQTIYAAGWYGYSVEPGWPHLFAIAKYVTLQVFSHYWSISSLLTFFCLFGLATSVAGRPRMFAIIATAFVAAYIFYFSQQAAFIVRNLLVIVPFLCLACARGVVWAGQRLPRKWEMGVYGLVASLLVVNFGWEVYAADQIKRRSRPAYFVRKFEEYAARSGDDVFLISLKLSHAIEKENSPLPRNAVTDPGRPYTKVAFLQSEGPDRFALEWPHNWWGMYDKTFGPLEVNLDAYATFIGNERILVASAAHFSKLPLKVTDISRF